MNLDRKFPQSFDAASNRDPRDAQGAEIIDLATRNVRPAVTRRKPRSNGRGLAAGVGIVALLGGMTLWSMDSARQEQKAVKPAGPEVPVMGQPLVFPPARPQAKPLAPAMPLPAPPPQAILAAPPQSMIAPAPNRHASPTLVFDAGGMQSPLSGSAMPIPGTAPSAGGNSNEDFAGLIGGAGSDRATAAAGMNPKTTVTQGTLIPAVLETAIETDVPGFVRAIVSVDVRSSDGTRVLVPRSSRLIGQYKSGLQAGQKRAYVIWTRLIRPDGVSVNIASPAIAVGGETGVADSVDSHFFKRFGSAQLLSVVGGQSAAAAVGRTAQSGPTIRVRQGEPIRVFTARELDFSKVPTE